MAGSIIAKLPPSWMDFALSLKHKRQEFSMAELIGSLNIEERARAKDTREKGIESSSANMLQKKNSNASHNNKKKNKQEKTTRSLNKQPFLKRKRTTKMVITLFAGVMSIGQVHAQTVNLSKRRNL
jgi:hypothetical protein